MKTELLEKLGIEKEAIDKIMAENGRDVEAQKTVTAAKEAELATAGSTIKKLQQTVKDFDGVDVKKLQADLATMQTKYNEDIAKTKLDSALNLALATGKAKNIKAVRAMLEPDSIKLDGDKLLGLDDQLKKLRESDPYMFEQAQDDASSKAAAKAKVDSGAKHQEAGETTATVTLLGALNEHYNQK